MNWWGIIGKVRIGKTGMTFTPLSLRKNILSGPWIIDFDSFITEEE